MSGMPARAKAGAAATGRAVVPLAAVTRRQARQQACNCGPSASPISPNPFEPLARPSADDDEDGNDLPRTVADTAQRPRATSAPPTPSRSTLQPPPTTPTNRPAAQFDKQTAALLAQSPVRTSNLATGRAEPTRRNVIFNLPASTTGPDTGSEETESAIVVGMGPRRCTPSPTSGASTEDPPSAWEVTRDALALYEDVQHVAAGVDRLIQDHLRAQHPAEVLLLGQLVTDAFRAFFQPHSEVPRRSASSHSSYASTAASAPMSTATFRSTSTTSSQPGPAQARTNHLPRRNAPTTGPARIFVRLPHGHPLRQTDPVAVREQANNAVPGTQSPFKTAYPVASGYALVARNQAAPS